MSSVNVTAVLICPAVNGVSCFAYILIIAFAAFDQIYIYIYIFFNATFITTQTHYLQYYYKLTT